MLKWIVGSLLAVSGAAAAMPPGLQNLAGELNAVPQVALPGVDVAAFKAQFAGVDKPPQPLVVAAPILTDLLPDAGRWEPLNDGSWLWRLRITSAGAKSLHLRFADLALPPGAALYVYAPGGEDVRGPYTASDVSPEGKLWTPLVRGDEAVVELVVPGGAREQASFVIPAVYYGIEEFWKADDPQFKEGACHVDVVCPQAAGKGDIVRSAGRITFDIVSCVPLLGCTVAGVGLCSGALINNTSGNGTPYFLTANHCVSSQQSASSVVAYWNYQKTSCNGPSNGSLNQTQTGSTLRATSPATDFTLLQLSTALNPGFNLFLSGWDRGSAAPGSAVTIHHPDGSEKRISFKNGPLQITSLPGNTSPGDGNALRVADWDLGATEPGSSGAGLWNGQNRLVGQLSQGNSACSGAVDNGGEDWYGRFARAWDAGGSSASRLRDWLDPGNTGATQVDGRNASTGGGTGGAGGTGGSGGGGSGGRAPTPVDDDGGGGGCTVAQRGSGLGLVLLLILGGMAWRFAEGRAPARTRPAK